MCRASRKSYEFLKTSVFWSPWFRLVLTNVQADVSILFGAFMREKDTYGLFKKNMYEYVYTQQDVLQMRPRGVLGKSLERLLQFQQDFDIKSVRLAKIRIGEKIVFP